MGPTAEQSVIEGAGRFEVMRGKGHVVDPENVRHGFSLQQQLVDIADYRRVGVSLIEGAADRGGI
jgi:hypothetical protein